MSFLNFEQTKKSATRRHDVFIKPKRVLIQKLDIEGAVRIKNHAYLLSRFLGLAKVSLVSLLIIIIGALSLVGQTVSYYGDKERSYNNQLQTGLVDFVLEDLPFAHLATSSSWQVTVSPHSESNPFYYYASSSNLSGDLDLCGALVVSAKVEDEQLYYGPLSGLKTATTTKLAPWTYTFTNFSAFPGKTCTFAVEYNGWQTRHDYDEGGYSDKEVVTYSITVPNILINQVFVGKKSRGETGPCLLPNALEDTSPFVIQDSGEKTIAQMFAEHGYGAIDVVNDQKNYQVWDVANPEATTLSFNVEVLGKRAHNSQILGYYKSGNTTTFTNILTQTNDTNGEEAVSVDLPPQTIDSFGFAIMSDGEIWYSEVALNSDGKDHLAVYEPVPDVYLLAFEDMPGAGDSDYNDLVLKIRDIECHDEEEEEELVIDIGDGRQGEPVCTDVLEAPVTIAESQVLLSHDEGGAFIGPKSTFIPAGTYNFTALSYDDHTNKPWDNLTKEIWHVNLYNDNNLVFTTKNTTDLPTGINWQVSQLDQNVTLPDVDAIEWVHGAFVDPTYQSIHPSCLWLTKAQGEQETAFVQLINLSTTTVDLAGYRLCDGNVCDILPPDSPTLPSQGYAYIVGDLGDLPDLPENAVVILLPDGIIGEGLKTERGMLQLFNPASDLLDQMNWGEVDEAWVNYAPTLWVPGLATTSPEVFYERVPEGFDTDMPSDWGMRESWSNLLPITMSLRVLLNDIELPIIDTEEAATTTEKGTESSSNEDIVTEVSTSTATSSEETSDPINQENATTTTDVVEEEKEEGGEETTTEVEEVTENPEVETSSEEVVVEEEVSESSSEEESEETI